MINSAFKYAPPVYINSMNTAIIKSIIHNENFDIEVRFHPFPRTKKFKDTDE